MKIHSYIYSIASLGIAVSLLGACKKNLPDDRLSIAADSRYNVFEYKPTLGRATLFANNFNYGNSSRPLEFKIVNMRTFTGEPAPELTRFYPVKVWKTAYDGTETSLAQIEAKQAIENHQLFEVRPKSGEFIVWKEANSNMIKAQPDSGYVFDVEMSNSGGRKYFQNMRLVPFRERPYEPSDLDPITGQSRTGSVNPSQIFIYGKRDKQLLNSQDVQVLFNRIPAGTSGYTGKNSITFRFVDSLFNTISPNKFAATDWANLLHGFNMQKDDTKVKYQVAYPIPLTSYPTKYTTADGSSARVVFRFDRIGFGNELQRNLIALNFRIFEDADWEVIFWFKRDEPNFDND
jgi:Domain of unknown function (DUF5007)